MEHISRIVCRSCRKRSHLVNAVRGFTTSSYRLIVPPESPAYIDVPSSFQQGLPFPKREKGVLPVPRELFPARGPEKLSSQYLDNLTKTRLSKNEVAYDTLSELGKYRHRVAQLRKRHVKEGLTELHQRKANIVAKMEHRSHERQLERDRLLSQPPREDVRLTDNTVPRSMKSNKSSTPVADDLAALKALQEQKRVNYDTHVAAKSEERLNALHTLYMNAREFITTEKQLDETIEQQFDEERVFRSSYSTGKSMWNMGPPDTVKDMIANSQVQDTPTSRVLDTVRGGKNRSSAVRFQRDQERMKKIAEKLSGGKI